MAARSKLAMCACAAAVGCAFAGSSAAQALGQPFEQIQAGLERAVRLPSEIVWLQSQIQADMWRSPGLAQSLDGSPLLVWSFGGFKAPFVKPRLNLAEGKRLFLVKESTVELVDGAYPNIHIELPAAAGRSLLEGLAAFDMGKIFSLLVQRSGPQSEEPLRFAALNASVIARPKPDALLDHIAKVVDAECMIPEVATPLPAKPERVAIAAVDLSTLAGRFEVPQARALGVAELPFPAVLLEVAQALPAPQIVLAPVRVEVAQPLPFSVASAMPAVLVEVAQALPAPEVVLAPVVVEVGQALPKPVVVAVAAPAAPKPVSTDLAKMRAEIDAEVARENERLAQILRGAGGKPFRFGT